MSYPLGTTSPQFIQTQYDPNSFSQVQYQPLQNTAYSNQNGTYQYPSKQYALAETSLLSPQRTLLNNTSSMVNTHQPRFSIDQNSIINQSDIHRQSFAPSGFEAVRKTRMMPVTQYVPVEEV